MNQLLLASIAATTVAVTTPAQANPTYHYKGGCGFFALSDGTDSPSTMWNGEIHIAAAATDHVTDAPAPYLSIEVECELRINGAPGTPVLSAWGTGIAVGAEEFTFYADPDDVLSLCEHVTVGGDYHKDCADATTGPLLPEPLQRVVNSVVCTIESLPESVRYDPCSILAAQWGGRQAD